LAGILGAEKSTKEEIEMAFAAWWGILNLVLTVALLAAVVYLFVLIVRALKKYIGSKEVRAEKRAVKRTLGETLKAHRIQCHMTQEFVAESLGVSRQTVSKWENGSADPSTTNLLAVAKLYDVPAEELLREVER
jgi:DNA-binding XRE family transcriptional regulator